MQGDAKVIDYLNKGLRSELTAINQYWLHYRFLNNWGLLEMAKVWRKESIEEMEHADKFTDRILFLDGFPNMQVLDPLRIGQNVKEIIECDLAAEIARARALPGSGDLLPRRQGLRHARPVREADEGRGTPHRLPRDPARPDPAHRPRTLHPEARRRARERGALETLAPAPAFVTGVDPGQAGTTISVRMPATAASCSALRPPPGFPARRGRSGRGSLR